MGMFPKPADEFSNKGVLMICELKHLFKSVENRIIKEVQIMYNVGLRFVVKNFNSLFVVSSEKEAFVMFSCISFNYNLHFAIENIPE